ncbi:MAG TPA: adenylate/guanylate cyclase domain-containing protein [Gemmatimonadaceae bacterium]|nr:adenylate/guanylate cyclase domain-containing protein [Gemmatimonadaceae bacterium]
MSFRLVADDGGRFIELREDAPTLIGRALGCDLPLSHATVSRRHAELVCNGDEMWVRDLGSSNGTLVNGSPITESTLVPGDKVIFGEVAFQVVEVEDEPAADASTTRVTAPAHESSLTRQELPPHTGGELPDGARWRGDTGAPASDLNARKLALLLEVARGLGGTEETGVLLEKITAFLFQIMDVDRVAVVLAEEDGTLSPRISRDRWGTVDRPVPQSIARTVLDDRVAILTDNAPEDGRFTGQSIVAQRVRSAMCSPLAGSGEKPLGVLYVDNFSSTHRFNAEDLDFLVAFSAIAAVALENGAFAQRIKEEALIRSNFERYFAPAVAARIAREPGAVQLGGEKRTVVVLFSDIRGFTALSQTMRPDDVASLLSEYFTAMVECVFRNGGMLDKFIGDALMAQWGAPIEHPDDADRAVRAAAQMMHELEVLNEKWRAIGRPELQIGIGLDRGEVFAGNIGSERRLEFTVIGDAVNHAWHLCTTAARGEVLMTERVRTALTVQPELAEHQPISVKGNGQAMTVHRLLQ